MASESYKFSEVEMSKSRIVKDRRSINKLLIYFSKMREEGGARVKGRLEKLQNESDLEASLRNLASEKLLKLCQGNAFDASYHPIQGSQNPQ